MRDSKNQKEIYTDSPEFYSEDSLLSSIANGNEAAFHALYEKTADGIYAYALSITKNKFDAEDVLQDTFVAIYQKASSYQSFGKPRAWIYTIARNLAFLKLREKKNTVPTDNILLEEQFSFSEIENVEERLLLRAAFSVLSEEEEQIILLHAVGSFKNREIADFLNLPLGTVLSKYHRGLKKLQKELQEEES